TKVQSFKKSLEKLKDAFSGEKRGVGRVLGQVETAISLTMELLAAELGASTTQYIPSQSALLPLFDAIYERGYKSVSEIAPAEKRKLLSFFLISSFNGSYSTSANHKLEEDLQTIRDAGKFPFEKLMLALKQRTPHRNRIEKDEIMRAYENVLRGRT